MAFDMTSGGAILLGILIALGTALNWPRKLDYLWAVIALLWGILGATGVF